LHQVPSSANDCIEPFAANQPIHTAGRYRESAPMLGSPMRERRPAW
jgi:hypothetical protein